MNARAAELLWYPPPDEAIAIARVGSAFERRYGARPAGVWAAPGRVNVIGEHVDYNAGLCLPFALPHRTYVALTSRRDQRIRVASAQAPAPSDAWEGRLRDVAPGTVDGWAAYAVGVPWALAVDGLDPPGFDAMIDGYVPLGSGLSSSAALECALAIALDDVGNLGLGGDDAGRARLAAACVRAENDVAGAPTGGMDQAAAMRCDPGHALLLDCRDFAISQVPFTPAAAGYELLVIDTRVHHAHADGRYGSRRDACAQAARILGVPFLRDTSPGDLESAVEEIAGAVDDPEEADEIARRVRHVVTEIARVSEVVALLRAQPPTAERFAAIGALLDASHASLCEDYEVSCPELDLACGTAIQAGAVGARMTGGGFGGSAIALVASAVVEDVATAVAEAFRARHLVPPGFLRTTPCGAAVRVD